jgi:Cell morphogenesis central region
LGNITLTFCRKATVAGGSALLRVSMNSNDASVRSLPPSAPPLSRAEAALCLLAEVALNHSETFRPHLPVLLLVCIVKADAVHPVVHGHARQARRCQ